MLDSEVETFVTVVASEATDDETLASDVFVLERPVLSWVTMDDVLDSEVNTLLTTLLTLLIADASDETWLEIELDSPGLIWAFAAVAPSHEVTPASSCGRGKGTPIAWSTIADEPIIRTDFTLRARTGRFVINHSPKTPDLPPVFPLTTKFQFVGIDGAEP